MPCIHLSVFIHPLSTIGYYGLSQWGIYVFQLTQLSLRFFKFQLKTYDHGCKVRVLFTVWYLVNATVRRERSMEELPDEYWVWASDSESFMSPCPVTCADTPSVDCSVRTAWYCTNLAWILAYTQPPAHWIGYLSVPATRMTTTVLSLLVMSSIVLQRRADCCCVRRCRVIEQFGKMHQMACTWPRTMLFAMSVAIHWLWTVYGSLVVIAI